MPVIGLTGNIGSGKSSVARMLKQMGAKVIDTDQVAREVVAPGTRGLKRIIEQFGPEMLNPDGTLNRSRMAQLVFSNPGALARLNAIVHPEIKDIVFRAVADYRTNKYAPLLVIEAPLLIETGMHKDMDEVWLVTINPQAQLTRIMQRDGISAEQARRRISAQMPQEEKKAYAHRIIDNSGPPEETLHQVRQIWHKVVNFT